MLAWRLILWNCLLYLLTKFSCLFFFVTFVKVGYKVRLEGVRGRDTRLLFCTTGILLRRLLVDRNLRGVTHVIVDEIHERGMNEGILFCHHVAPRFDAISY